MKRELTKRKIDVGKYGVFIILIVIFVFFAVITDSFLNYNNLFNVARQVSMIGICAVGMTFVLLTGGIDISVGSVIAMQSVICSIFITQAGIPIPVAILITLLLGCGIGLVIGFFVTKYAVPAVDSHTGTHDDGTRCRIRSDPGYSRVWVAR